VGNSERYEMLEKIGRGSFATVYRARDTELHREVAIKQIHEEYLEDPEQLDRYWNEAQLLASLQHPNIVTVFDLDRERGWLVLELMQSNLAERMQGRPMDLRSLKTTVAHCLRAKKYLHERGIIHGDIKPSNLMIDSRRRIKMGDFGLARRVSDEDGSLLKGTTKYMAPEVVTDEFGDIGPPSDLYSLGFSAYELMCGPNFESLFPGLSAYGRNKQAAWMMWHAAADRRLPPVQRVLEGVPEDLERVVDRLVQKDQADRYVSAAAALEDLGVDTTGARRERRSAGLEPEDDEDSPERKKRLWLAGGALGMSLVLSLVMLLMPSGSEPPPADDVIIRMVAEVFPDDNQLKVEDLEKTLAEKISLGPRPRIRLRNTGQNILLDELQPGDRIEIETKQDADGNRFRQVIAARPVASQGRIISLDVNNRQLVMSQDSGQSRDELKMRVAEGCEIQINDVDDKRIEDLQEEDMIAVKHLPEVRGRAGRVLSQIRVRRLQLLTGVVSEVDVPRGFLTLRMGDRSRARSMRLPFSSSVRIRMKGADEPLAAGDLKSGDRVRVQFDTEFQMVEVMSRNKKRGNGKISAIDGDNRTLVVNASQGMITVQVSPETDVTVSLEPTDFSELRITDDVQVAYDEGDDGNWIAASVDAARGVRHDRWAVIITTQSFDDRSLTRRPHAMSNATLLRDAFLKRYAFDESRVLLLRNQTRAAIEQQLVKQLKDAGDASRSQLIVYVCAPAYVDDNKQAYLAGTDFRWDSMDDSGVSLAWMIEQLESCNAESKLLLLDCSRGGSGADLKRQPSDQQLLNAAVKGQTPGSTSVIAGSQGAQRGLDWPEMHHGLFAHFLAAGFSGSADENQDLRLTPSELQAYLMGTVAKQQIDGKLQTPLLIGPK